MRQLTTTQSKLQTALLVVVPVICALVVIAVRLHRLEIALERDEGEYAYIAQMFLRGEAPYTEAYTMKLPGVPLCYALAFLVFGETTRAIHLAGLIADLLSALSIAWWCRSVGATDGRAARTLPLLAACCFVVLSSLLCFEGFTANCEKFVVVFATSSFAVFAATRGRAALFGAGLLMGMAFLCKQQALPWLVLLCALAGLRGAPGRMRLFDRATFVLCAGFGILTPYIATILIAFSLDVFDAFWFQTVSYASKYVGISETPMKLFMKVTRRTVNQPLVWFSLCGVVLLPRARSIVAEARWTIALWCVGAVVALSIGLHFRPHYFFYVTAPLAAAVATLAVSWRGFGLALSACLLGSLSANAYNFFTRTDEDVSESVYSENTFNDAVTMAEVLASETVAGERVLILGSEPELLFLADRRSVTPYIYLYPLIEPQPFAEAQQRAVMDAVLLSAPDHLVLSMRTLHQIIRLDRFYMQDWTFDLLQNYEIVWPHAAPGPITRDTLSLYRSSMYLMRRIAPPALP